MKKLIFALSFVFVLSGASVACAEHAAETLKQEVDAQAASGDPSQFIADRLAITTDRVATLKSAYPSAGWGELAGRFALAKEVSEGSNRFAGVDEAMAEISRLRDENVDWQEITDRLHHGSATDTHAAPEGGADLSREAQELRGIQQEIDDKAHGLGDEKQFEKLSEQFHVTRETITGLRERHRTKGWGEVTILLAVAFALHEAQGISMDDALSRVESARANQATGWDTVASRLNVQLRPAVDSARHVREAYH